MNAEAKAWLLKAEGDYIGASALAANRSRKIAHLTSFAAQQSSEKYLKAYLVEHNISFPKTHDLAKELLPRCLNVDESFSVLEPYLEFLDPYAVQFRYPGDIVTPAEAREALKAATTVRKFVRQKLGLNRQQRML
ncbi:MAG: HEPN domain-containing protein [Ignavibacteriales bacterium]|nr:HEPN domain-containing protein [Ignavibacteriales bacterium]